MSSRYSKHVLDGEAIEAARRHRARLELRGGRVKVLTWSVEVLDPREHGPPSVTTRLIVQWSFLPTDRSKRPGQWETEVVL